MAVTLVDQYIIPTSYLGYDSSGRTFAIQRNGAGSNYWNNAAFDYFSDTAVANDYIQFAFQSFHWGIQLEVGTAFAATSQTFVWEYYSTAATWKTLPVTNNNAFLSTGTQIVTWTPPPDWSGLPNVGLMIRCRLSAVSGITEGGANATTAVKWNIKSLVLTSTSTPANALATDLAGTYEILPATTSAANLVPVFMPIDLLGKVSYISCVLAGATLGAGDTVDITGEDIIGGTITESIDVSGGNATYTSAKMYRKSTNVTCTGFSDGTITVNQKRWGIIDKVAGSGSASYRFGIHLCWGNNSTATTQTLYGYNFSFFPDTWFYLNKATINLYYCTDYECTNYYPGIGHVRVRDWTSDSVLNLANFESVFPNGNYSNYEIWRFYYAGHTFTNVQFTSLGGVDYVHAVGATFTGVKLLNIGLFLNPYSFSATFTNCIFGSCHHEMSASGYLTYINCSFTAVVWVFATSSLLKALNCPLVTTASFSVGYSGIMTFNDKLLMANTLDLHIQDTAGNAIVGATVVVKDSAGTTILNTTTNATGDIAQTECTNKSGSHVLGSGSFVWVAKTPHTVTIRKTGYQDKTVVYSMDIQRVAVETMKPSLINVDEEQIS